MTKSGHLYETRLPNGINGDPLVYCLSQRTGDALLFDLGDLSHLSNKELLKVRQVAITHTHLDHFIGFDRLLRVNVPHFRSLEFCGPPGLAENVYGKMRGYCWNLLEPRQITLIVHEIDPFGVTRSFELTNDQPSSALNFQPRAIVRPATANKPSAPPIPEKPAALTLALPDGSHVDAIVLDHGTPVCAYMVSSPTRFLVKSDALAEIGLPAGPWIRELQLAMAENDLSRLFTVAGKSWRAEDLGSLILERGASKNLAYLTDFIFSRENLDRLCGAFLGVQRIVCETNYRDVDRERARQKKHLTTRQAALIAAVLGARELETFHISNLYVTELDRVVAEAQEFFSQFKALSKRELKDAVNLELR